MRLYDMEKMKNLQHKKLDLEEYQHQHVFTYYAKKGNIYIYKCCILGCIKELYLNAQENN